MFNSTSNSTQGFHSGCLATESFCFMLLYLNTASPAYYPPFQVYSLSHSLKTTSAPPSPSHSQLISLPQSPWGKIQEFIRNSHISSHHHTAFLPTMMCLFLSKNVSLLQLRPLQEAMALDIVDHSHVLQTFFYLFPDTTQTYVPPMSLTALLLSLC